MTTFAAPLYVKPVNFAGDTGANVVLGKIPARYSIPIGVTQTGLAVGATTIPLFVAPAGSVFYECVIDVLTAYDQSGAGTNIQIGVPTSTGILFAATTGNIPGRRAFAGSAAQVSALAIPLAADTTVQAIVSINTSTVTVGSLIVHVVLA